jgi:tetratricopeptide (TPR) repeat protein
MSDLTPAEWENEIDRIWVIADDMTYEELRSAVEELAEAYPGEDGAAVFEIAGSWDSTERSDKAVPLYQQALEMGLDASRRRRAVIQLASSLRNIGEAGQSESLLRDELESGSDELDDAVVGFLALALADLGREREALSLSLQSLAPHLPRYVRSLTDYAKELGES